MLIFRDKVVSSKVESKIIKNDQNDQNKVAHTKGVFIPYVSA